MAQPSQPNSGQPTGGWRPHAVSGVVFALLFVLLANVRPFSRWNDSDRKYFFAAALTAPVAGAVQVSCRFFGGVRPTPSGQAMVEASPTPRFVRMSVPGEELRAVLFEPHFPPGAVLEIRDPQIVNDYNQVVHRFTSADAKATLPGTLETAPGGVLRLSLTRGSSITFQSSGPIALGESLWPDWRVVLAEFAGAALAFGTLCALLSARFPGAGARLAAALGAWAARRPGTAIFIAALGAVLLSCHPIVFLGRSFVSPNNGAECLYDEFPSLPGATDVESEDGAGSDLGAMMWACLPYSAIQHEALAQGEWPLRNRYAYCALGLQGQGISMFGDPLHFIPVAANGAAWAWDIKFLLAKLLFAWGAGLLAFTAARHVGIAVLLAASAPFIGFFAFRFNHPAFFSLCYAPWILLPWLRAAECESPRAAWKWMLLLILASIAELNSGAMKEATMLLGMLNFAGLLAVLCQHKPWRARFASAGAMMWANVLFVLVAAPFWLTFLDLLRSAFTVYDQPKVFQIQPSLLVGLFDDLFYRQFQPREQHFSPSANFLLLLGVLWSLVRWRDLARQPLWLASVSASVPALAIVFGVLPPSWIAALPFIGRVWHVDNCFSLPAIVLAFVPAALGLRECLRLRREPAWPGDWLVFAALLGGLYALYFGSTHAAHRSGLSMIPIGKTVPKSPFFMGYSAALAAAILTLPWLWRRQASGRLGPAGWMTMLVALIAIHFRHGMYAETKFDPYVMNPQPRQDIHAPSPAMEAIRRRIGAEPARVMGLAGNLSPDFNAVYRAESPFGCDPVLSRWQWELADAAGVTRIWDWRVVLMKPHFPQALPMLNLFGVRFLVTLPGPDKQPIPGLAQLGERDLIVHENQGAWPRAFFTDRIARYGKPADFMKIVVAGESRPVAAVENDAALTPPLAALGADPAGRAIVAATGYALTANTTSFHVAAPGAGVVVLGEAFEAGNYRVTINGAPADPLRINHAFLGVPVPAAGEYDVRFTYRPRVWSLALGVATAGLLLLLLTAVAARARPQQPT